MALLGEDKKLEDYQTIEPRQVQAADIKGQLQPKEETPADIIRGLYDMYQKERENLKPKFDTTTPEYLKKTAKLNALAKGMSAVSDIYSLAKGGNVNPPKEDTKTGAYTDAYFKYIDDYRNELNDWNAKDFGNRMNLGQMSLSEAIRNQSMQREDKQIGDNRDFQREMQTGNQEYQSGEKDKDRDFSDKRDDKNFAQQKELMRLQYSLAEAKRGNDLADWIQKESMKVQFDRANNSYILFDNNGTPKASVTDDGDMQRLYSIIMADPKIAEDAKNIMKLLKAEMGEGVTMSHMKVLVSKLWDTSPQAQQYLSRQQPQQQQTQIPQNWQSNARPDYNGPVRPGGQQATQTQPKVNNAIDYSNLTY